MGLQWLDRFLAQWPLIMSAPEASATGAGLVQFGSTVTFVRDDGRQQTFRIVGEDEANPSTGTISHVSPLAKALLGKQRGEIVRVGVGDAEIVEIE